LKSRDLVRLVGEALFGDRWQAPLGRLVDVNDRTVRRWAAGEDQPRPGVWESLLRAIKDREVKLREARQEVERLPND
jgi:hypothetical protein